MSIKIKAVAFKDIKQVELVERETPDLRPDEVLVKVHAVALCTMEQRLFTGALKMPMLATGGHEVAGEIAAMGSAINKKKWAEHDRVVVRLLFNCGECYYCRTGHTNMCEKSKSRPVRENLLPGPGGGLADYVIVNAASLFKIPDTLTYEEACLTEPLACVVHSVNRANIQLGEDVVVIGGGIMGQYHVMLAKRKGARVILSEVDPARAELAKKLGADVVFNPIEVDPVEFVKSVTEGRGADVVFNSGMINHKPERTSRYIFCAQDNGTTITIKEGTFKNDRAKNSFFWADGGAVIYVEGGTFNGVASNKKVVTSNGGQVIITGGTFNFDPTAWVPNECTVTKSGSTWTVSK